MTAERYPKIPNDTYEELIDATISAIYKHGYSNLGVRDIDAEFSKSRQLINHYFDGKDELITELLLYILEYDDDLSESDTDDKPLTKLNREIDNMMFGGNIEESDYWVFMTVIYEILTQARHNSDHRQIVITMHNEYISHLSEILQECINDGTFTNFDTVQVAILIDDLISGAQIRKINLHQGNAPREARRTIDQFIISQLMADLSTDT
jgi:AcrR family transcriptional regulator